MPTIKSNQQNNLCGLSFWHPLCLQRFATAKSFMTVYGLLGTVQAMSYMYFVVTLTTIEKRFKIPSQTTGIILSGNEISQILLSLILSYLGGQRNRPRWIAWGIVICGLSCFILALPHFVYGAGDEILQYTKEYIEEIAGNQTTSIINSAEIFEQATHKFCTRKETEEYCGEIITIVPLVLIFLSQFVLGIGNTLYYSLGQTYLDDNSKKTNTPLMLALAMSLRMVGPVIGFFLGYVSLNIFIDPTKTPLIDKEDTRWLGAWWFGWIILGSALLLFSGFIGMFPKQLPKNKNDYQVVATSEKDANLPFKSELESVERRPSLIYASITSIEAVKMKDFPEALMGLLKNKLLIYNIIAGIFYILGSAGYITFLTKYIEVQFHQTAQGGMILIGPLTIIGMIFGLLGSGYVISKYKPNTSKVLFWNVIVGFIYMLGELSYMGIHCGDTSMLITNGKLNLTSNCNNHCSCDSVSYSPVCHMATSTTYFSSCHAGCEDWDSQLKAYANCSCIPELNGNIQMESTLSDNVSDDYSFLRSGACLQGCTAAYYTFTIASMITNWFGSSGRVGNILVNYRAVKVKDKSFAQGLALMMISLFALIPGPIIFGKIIDSTCLLWTASCNNNQGHCQLYDQKKFRYYVNLTAFGFTLFGVFFDFLVWYYGRSLNLYDEVQKSNDKSEKSKKVASSSNDNHFG